LQLTSPFSFVCVTAGQPELPHFRQAYPFNGLPGGRQKKPFRVPPLDLLKESVPVSWLRTPHGLPVQQPHANACGNDGFILIKG
jgi:hypothetical protein